MAVNMHGASKDSNNNSERYAPNTISRARFVNSIAKMAGEVWDFHDRFRVGSGRFNGQTAAQIIASRSGILEEEFSELAQAIAEEEGEMAVTDETADVLFVAMGHVEAMGAKGIEGVNRVTKKNTSKTHKTHAIRPDTGKLLPKSGKPHKWK